MLRHRQLERLRRSSRADHGKLAHVTKDSPCPICQKTDWCGVTADGVIVICMRQPEGAIRQSRNYGYVHLVSDQPATFQPIASKPQPVKASIERRDAVYSELLKNLTLTERHFQHLANERRLSDLTIRKAGFRSVPSRMLGDALAAQLAAKWELKGVPGFWRKDGRWCLRFAGIIGFFIPIKNAVGQIEGLQIRTFNGKAKYLLLSSANLPEGISSGTPHHFTGQPCQTVIVTEGALKAEVIAEAKRRRGEPCFVIGLVSVSTFGDSFGAELRHGCPSVRVVQLAFDSDWQTNPNVQLQMRRFAKSVKDAGLTLQVLAWEAEQGKGYDDLLLRGEK